MQVEAVVLDRDHRVLEVGGDLLERHVAPLLVEPEPRPVRARRRTPCRRRRDSACRSPRRAGTVHVADDHQQHDQRRTPTAIFSQSAGDRRIGQRRIDGRASLSSRTCTNGNKLWRPMTRRLDVRRWRSFCRCCAPCVGASGCSRTSRRRRQPAERDFLTRVRRLTVEGRAPAKATGRRTASGSSSRASASRAIRSTRSTCSTWPPATPSASRPASARRPARSSDPDTDEILFASTHHDPKSKQLQDEELAFRASGKERRYSWDYDPEMEHLRLQREDRRAEAADQRARLRRRGQLLARRPVDRVLVDARRLRPHAVGRRAEAARDRPELLRRDLHHARRRLRPEAADQRRRLRRRPVLHARRQADRLAPVRRAGPDRRRLDDEAGRHRRSGRSPTSAR